MIAPPALKLQAVRLIVLALGDYHLFDPSVEAYTAYELSHALSGRETPRTRGVLEG